MPHLQGFFTATTAPAAIQMANVIVKHNQQSQIKEKTSKLQTLSACLRHNLQNTKNTTVL